VTVLPWLLPVDSFLWDYPANAALWIRNIAIVAWDYVDMNMRHGLASGFSVIDAHVEGVRAQFVGKMLADFSYEVPYRPLDIRGKIEDAGYMLLRDNKCVSLGNRETVFDGDGVFVLEPYLGLVKITKWAVHHNISSGFP
jgi:hypothetical protein